MTRLKPLPRQTVLCRPTLNIPFTCLPHHHIHFHGIAMCNYAAWTSGGLQPPICFDFEQKSQLSSLIVVVPGCGEGVVGEECNCALDWFPRKSHSVVPPLPFFPTSSLPFLSSWQRVWVFERRKGIREPVFLISPYYLKTYMQLGTCTTSTFLLEEMNLCWYAKIRAWDSDSANQVHLFSWYTVAANNKINSYHLLITYAVAKHFTCSISFHLH